MKIIFKLTRGGVDKLKLIRSKVNSGGAGTPRNIGMKISRAEYITFVDSDDIITKTAIEEFYVIAKKFDADVVACEKYFEIHGRDILPQSYITGKFVNVPTLVNDNLFERALALNHKEYIYSMCMKLIRRDFIIEENLELLDIMGEDALMTWCMVCAAKKYVRIPNITYLYRIHNESAIHRQENLDTRIKKWFNSLTKGFCYLDKFLSRQKFFNDNLEARYLVLDALVKEFVGIYIMPLYAQIPTWQMDALIRKELECVENKTALMAFLFSRMNVFNVNMNRQGATIQQMNAYIQRQNQVIQQLQAQIKQLKGQ